MLPPPPTTVIKTMKVLLVADETWVRQEVEAALSEARFELKATDDPYAAVDACKEAEADVVIADLQVGTMGGMAVVRAIRAAVDAGALAPTATVLLLDRNADAFLAGRAGSDAAIRKPFGSFEMRDLLDRLAARTAGAEA